MCVSPFSIELCLLDEPHVNTLDCARLVAWLASASGAPNYSLAAGVLDPKPDLMRCESDEGSAGSGMLSADN